MPDTKRYSTGRIGNTHPAHENTDHVNTKGLDDRGLPGIEGFIDEDIVRAYDDNRPLVNLLSNDEMLSRSADDSARSADYGAYLRNDNDDWRLTIGTQGRHSDPEDFTREVTTTPLNVARGTAYAPDSGVISTGYKKIAGFRRDDGTTLWVDEHDWFYDTTPILDDPVTSYTGFYRTIYVELPESTLPDNFEEYQITVRQLTSTGSVYTYPIYLEEDLVIPLRSSTFTVEDEQTDFAGSEYPGYDFYPESFVQLESSGLGVLEIGEDAEVVKFLKKEEHRLLASQFNSEAGAFTAELKSDVFRESKSANVSRIENDVNFIRSMVGVKAYNGSSRVYFNDFKDILGVLQPLKDNRHFLGNQELSFEIAFVDNAGDQDLPDKGFYTLDGEDVTEYSNFNGIIGQQSSPNYEVIRSDERVLNGDYATKVDFNVDTVANWVAGDLVIPTDYDVGSNTTDILHCRFRIYIPSTFRMDNSSTPGAWVMGIGDAAAGGTSWISLGITGPVVGTTNDTPTRWQGGISTLGSQTAGPQIVLDEWHEVELYFTQGATTGGGEIKVDGAVIYSDFTRTWPTNIADVVFIGAGFSAGIAAGSTIRSGSEFYVDDLKADRFKIVDNDDRYKTVKLASPETRGFQDWGVSEADPDAALSIALNTYKFTIQLNNDTAATTLEVDVTATDSLRDIRDKINLVFASNSVYAYARVWNDGGNWELRTYSRSSGDYSKVVLGDATPPLRTALGSAGYESPDNGQTNWEIYFDAGTPGQYSAEYTGESEIGNDFDPADVGDAIFEGLKAVPGLDNFIVAIDTTTSFSHTCELYIEPSTAHTQGYQELGMNVPDTGADSGLLPLSEYYFKLNIDGQGLVEYSMVTTTDVTYSGVVNTMNEVLAARAIVTFTGTNDIRISSDSYGPTSSILTADGTTGNSLFGFAYPAAGFPPSAQHLSSVVGTGKLIYVRPRKIDSFTIFEDSTAERVVYTHYNDAILFIAPDTETDIKDHIDTEHAYITGTSAERWSTHNDRVIQIDMSNNSDWTFNAVITKVDSIVVSGTKYLLVGNNYGQIFFIDDTKDLYDDDFDADQFSQFTSAQLGESDEKINNFYVYEPGDKYLFVLTDRWIYYADITSSISAATAFTAINTSSSTDVSNVTGSMFVKINDAIGWDVDVNSSNTNQYVIFVGDSAYYNSWESAPILYALYDGASSFDFYAEEIYKKTHIDNIASIVKYSGWSDPEQVEQIFISNNAKGPELWAGNSLNNYQDIGGGGDERFDRFSWVESNLELGKDSLSIDTDLNTINSLEIFDSKIFAGGIRASDTYSGFYSFGATKLQKYFAVDVLESKASSDGTKLYSSVYRGSGANSDPAILVTNEELDDGRAQIFSQDNLSTVSNWPADSSFRVALNGFNVGGIDYDGVYNVTFDGQGKSNLSELVDAMNGADIDNTGFAKAVPESNPLITVDLTPVIRARDVTSLEKFGNTYTERYKIAIESKTADVGEAGGFTSTEETTQSDCTITITHPTVGTTVVGTGSDTMEIETGTIGYANLQLVDWDTAKASQVNRVSSSSLSFSGNTYVNISSILASGYSLLTGSLRVKANDTDEIGWSQGAGRILKTDTAISLSSTIYTFEVQFNEYVTPIGGPREASSVICPADVAGSLSGTYFLIYTPTDQYYVWYDVDNLSTDPEVLGRIGIEVNISTGNADTTVATNTAAAINAVSGIFSAPAAATISIGPDDQGNVVDTSDVNSGVIPSTITQGQAQAPVRNIVEIDGSSISDIQDLLDAINAGLSSGTASLQAIGGTAENCDIVITSSYVGDDSSVEIKEAPYGTYLFSTLGIDTVTNDAIPGSTVLTTAGSQTFGYTWENADYFIDYDHPDTSQVRVYIPNGTTRLDTGATIWLDFWQYRELTKIPAKVGNPPLNNTPAAGEWTYNLEEKKVVVGEQPTIAAPEDYVFVDAKVQKVLRLLDLGASLPASQTDLSDTFHSVEPRNLTNSDVSVARALARLSALHYGVLLWGTDTDDSVLASYSFFLPRLDLVSVRRDQDVYGNRIHLIKGRPDAETPWVEVPLTGQDEDAYLYTAFVNSQDYTQNDILTAPWYLSNNLQRGIAYLDGTSQYFKPNTDLVSTRGLTATRGSAPVSKIALNGDYDIVKVTDPVGVLNERKRTSAYVGIDGSQTIFVDTVAGDDLSNGFTRNTAKLTIQDAIDTASTTRPYVLVIRPIDGSKITTVDFTININFKIYLIAEKVVSATNVFVNSECYLEGIETLTAFAARTEESVTAKYCDFKRVRGTGGAGSSLAGHNIWIYNSIVREGYFTNTETFTDDINITFDHVYVAESATIMTFDSIAYNSAGQNNFTFNNVTTSTTAGNIIECPETTGISIDLNRCLIPSGTATVFNSNASIVINQSMAYAISNLGTGSVITNESQLVSVGDLNIISASGASESIARGFTTDSLALNYINREEDVGAFLEERVESIIQDDEQHSDNESYLDFEDTRSQFRYNIMSDKFTFFMRFKPLLNYQQTGVLFDSRYDKDFDYVSGLFNQNATDFMQIVYDNKTYERNELTADKYSFKFITSNSSATSISVIGPYFTVDDNSDYSQWHEISIVMSYRDTYNNKYELADVDGTDAERKQMIIYTMFDRDIDRVYALKNEPYEDAGSNTIPTSNWFPESVVGRFFNIGGGWDATWFATSSGKEWSTWSEARYSMIVDDFLVSSDIIPVNIMKDFGAREKIDLKDNDYRVLRYDDKNAGIILHCDNPHPYSENGLQPFDTVNTSFRQYEGFESHGVAVESASPNLLVDGRIKRGDWFDRSEARIWDDTISWTTWGNVSGLDSNLVAIVAESTGGNLFIKYVDPITGTVDSSVQLLTGASLSEVKALVVGSRIVVGYIDGSSQLKFKTWDGSIQGGPYTVTAGAVSYFSMSGGHSSSQVAFAYRDNTATLGFATVMRTDNGAVVTAATTFSAGADITYNAITETTDKDGNLSYTFFYRLASSDWLNFVMYTEDLTATVFPPDTLIVGEEPIDIKTTTFTDGQIFVKWKDYNVGADSPVKAAYLNREGTELAPPFEVFPTASPDSMTDDFVQQRDFKVLMAAKDRTSGDIQFRLYQEVGTTVGEANNSPYLRDFDESATSTIFLGLPTEGSIAMATTVNDGTYDTGTVIELETDIPSRWYKDFSGVYDEFSVSAEKTRTLYGWAYYQRFNHQQSAGETSAYHVASAEEPALVPPWTTYASTDGSFTQTAEAAVHGTLGYTLSYNGTGGDVRLTKTGAWGTDIYARFYMKIDKFFSLGGTSPRQLEIARLKTTGGDDLILLIEYNDPLSAGDGKYKLVAQTTAYGTATTAGSVLDYSTNHIVEFRYNINVAGGWEVWVDEVSVLSNSTNTSAETGISGFRIGSESITGDIPTSGSKLYFDSIKVDNAAIGPYTAGLGQGEIWQPIEITTNGVDHFISFYYWIISGSWVMRLEGAALNQAIEFTFSIDDDDPYVHETATLDTVDLIDNYEVNFNKIRRHTIRFTPDNLGTLNVRLRSTESSVGDAIDEFYVDNVKVEQEVHPTSIEAEQNGYIEYPYAMKQKGSVFLRVIPEFLAGASEHNHTIFSAYAQDESGAEYISHELYYDESANTFKFYIQDIDGTTVEVESDQYGDASTSRQLTDLNSKHNIVCNWDVVIGYVDLRIDNEQYIDNNVTLGEFPASTTTLIGNRRTGLLAADTIFDLVRFGEEPFGCRQIEDFSNKRDPFFHQNKTDIGSVNVKSMSFFGLTSSDQFEKTIYTETVDGSWRLVIDKGNEFASEVTIRHDGEDIITFGTTGVTIDGSLSVGTLVATTVATINTTDDHLTLRFGFSGSPPSTNDGYFEVERGNLVNSELRWDESHRSWTVHDGTTNNISIDGTKIGAWKSNDWFNLVSNGTGSISFSTNSSTNGGSGDGLIPRTSGTERFKISPAAVVVNEPGNDVDFRAESISKPYMLFSDAGNETVVVGRVGGTIPAAAKTTRDANLAVNKAISVVSQSASSYGTVAFYTDSGLEGAYIGRGNSLTTPSYVELRAEDADEIRVSGGDLVISDTDGGFAFTTDRTNARFDYTADAPNYTPGSSDHGFGFYGSIAAYKIYNAVWNDYAEGFEFDKSKVVDPEPGYVYKMTESGIVPTERRVDSATIGVYSDTYGGLLGSRGIYDDRHPDGYKLPIGLMGKVKVWTVGPVSIGDPLVSDSGGFAAKATPLERKELPDLIIGKALENHNEQEPKRIWMLIK